MPNTKNKIKSSSKLSSFKIVLLYAVVSAIYIYTSDYFLKIFVTNIELLTKLQTYKGFGFILITATLLYILVKKNIDTTTSSYQQIIDVKQISDNQLIKSQSEYISLFNHSPLPMWLFDVETLRFLLVNNLACSIYGFTHEEYSSMTLKDIRPPEDISLMNEVLSACFKNEHYAPQNIVRHRKKNGEIIQVKVETTFVIFEEKKVILASAVNVSAEMDIQNKLMESNSKLQLASEIANLGYWTNDFIKSEIQWSDEVYKIFELNPQTFKLTINNIKNCFHPDDQIEFNPNLKTNFEDKTIKESERRIITGSGNIKWVLERINLIKDTNGKPIKLDGIVIDITKRKLHEQEISESNERFKIIAKATIEAIIDWDIKNDKVIWGEGFHTIFGYDLSEYNNNLWSNNIHPEDREKVLEDLNKILEDSTKEHFNAEFRFLKANGDVTYVQHKGILIRDANGKAIRGLAAMFDLTESLDKMRKIKSQNKALKDIAWTQSHIVRAPLANLQGFISLLKDNINSGVTDDKLIDYITDSALKLDGIIRDIVNKTRDIDDL
jgi:PAS domain S-box-containing protein